MSFSAESLSSLYVHRSKEEQSSDPDATSAVRWRARLPPVRAGLRTALLLAVWALACENPLAPDPCGPIPQVTVHVGETSSVTACFNDPNGDMLSYTVASSNRSVATATVAGATITVSGVAPGSATVRLTARDPGGLQGQQSFQVMVPNRAPQIRGTPPSITVQVGESATVEVSQYFTEPDGEMLTYTAVSSDAEVAAVSVAGSAITVTAEAKGSATITITATDPGGLSATQSFRMTVPNRPPVPVGAIDAQTIEVGQSATLDAAVYFSDPDGDPLTYTVTSSNSGVARGSVRESTLTIAAVAAGRATLTVTASDQDGSAQQTFRVTVPNRAPRRVGSIPAQTIEVGERATVNASRYFSDPDGDALTYTATSSNSSVARASASGSTVTITAARAGSATITVTARDPEGLSATQQVRVTVPQPNRAPRRVGSIPAQTIEVGERTTVNASRYFSDPDGDALTYTATSSNSSVARASASGSTVTITAARAGSATITVTARDPEGLSATQQVRVTVPQPNRAPRRVGSIPAQTIEAGERATVNASRYFSDPDGDALTYTATSSNSSVARTSVSGFTVTITAASDGSATVRVTATDPDGLSATQSFAITVEGAGNRSPATVGSIAAKSVNVGESVNVNVSSYFNDPDGDALTYTARSSNTGVVTASVSGSTVTMTGVAVGSATVRVTATDPGDLSATQSFTVTVQSGGGQAMTVEIESCTGTLLVPGTQVYRITITGTVRANRAVTFVRATGYVNGVLLGVDLLGSIAAGQSEDFSITGVHTLTQTTARCEVRVEGRTAGATAGRELRVRASAQSGIRGVS